MTRTQSTNSVLCGNELSTSDHNSRQTSKEPLCISRIAIVVRLAYSSRTRPNIPNAKA